MTLKTELTRTEARECLAHDLPAIDRLHGLVQLSRPRMTIPAWAEKKRVMPAGSPFEGPWKNINSPYMVELAEEASSQSPTEVITFVKPGQIAGTVALAENKIGQNIDIDPRHILYITATEDLAGEWSKKRFGPMLEMCGVSKKIRSLIKRRGSRATGDTTLSKSFPGGGVRFASYNQASQFRSMSYQDVIFDEIDTAPESVGDEGSARKLGEIRTSMFEGRKKIIILSTPKMLATSKVWAAFLEGDQRYYWVPCPHCDEMIRLDMLNDAGKINLDFDYLDDDQKIVNPASVNYPCPECGCGIKNFHKREMYLSGRCEWRPTNPNPLPKNKSYAINALYAAVGGVSFEAIAQEYVSALSNVNDMIVFVNLRAGLPYEEKGDEISDDQIEEKKGGYVRGTVPDGPKLVTCGCDLHGDRLDVEIVGFDGDTTWSIDWLHIAGDPDMSESGSLRKFSRQFAARTLPGAPKIAFIDDGYKTANVLKCQKSHPDIFAAKGEDWINGNIPFQESIKKKFDGEEFIRVNTGLLKGEFFSNLALGAFDGGELPAGFPSFPRDYEQAFYDQINSEKLVSAKNKRGVKWEVFHTKGNHALDCRVYSMAAAAYHIYRIAKKMGIKENYIELIWSILRMGNGT